MPKVHVLVISYEKPRATRILIDSFIDQSWPHWEMTVIHDGPASKEFNRIISAYTDAGSKDFDSRVKYIETETRQGNWGNENRKIGVQLINGKKGDFVLVNNNDNYHPPKYLEYMMRVVKPNVGMVYCDFLHWNYEYKLVSSVPKLNQIDMAAYIVEISLAKKIGFRRNDSAMDGTFAEDCYAYCLKHDIKAIHVPLPLLVHN